MNKTKTVGVRVALKNNIYRDYLGGTSWTSTTELINVKRDNEDGTTDTLAHIPIGNVLYVEFIWEEKTER